MSDKNKTLVRRSWELPDNLDIIHEVYAPDLVWHDPDRDIKGAEEARQFVSTYKTAFPDLQTRVEDVIAEGDKVVTRWTVRGTHQGEVEEFGPSDRQTSGDQRHHDPSDRRGQDRRGVE